MNHLLRLLDESDVQDYRKLRLESFLESPFAFSESYEDEKDRSLESFQLELAKTGTPYSAFTVGAFAPNNQLIAFARFKRDTRTKGLHKAMVFGMYTHQDFRAQGLGTSMMNFILNHAQQLTGLEQIHLWALKSRHSNASKFYQKLGFVSQGIVRNDLIIQQEYVDAVYFVKYLD